MVTRTRPICAYPQVARYVGSGSIDDAANFVCREPRHRTTAMTIIDDDQPAVTIRRRRGVNIFYRGR